MKELITLEMIYDLPQKIMHGSKEYQENAILLRKEIYSKFDIKKLKRAIISCFDRYSIVTYLYPFPNYNIASKYELKENMHVNTKKDQVGDFVARRLDEQIWATQFYYCLLNLSKKLTHQEIIYLIDFFCRRKTEESISEKLGICRNTLRGIKGSCIVKIWTELESLFES